MNGQNTPVDYNQLTQRSFRDVGIYSQDQSPHFFAAEVSYVRKSILNIKGVEPAGVSEVSRDMRGIPRFFMPIKYQCKEVDLQYFMDVRGNWWILKASSNHFKSDGLDALTRRIYSDVIMPRMDMQREIREETKIRQEIAEAFDS